MIHNVLILPNASFFSFIFSFLKILLCSNIKLELYSQTSYKYIYKPCFWIWGKSTSQAVSPWVKLIIMKVTGNCWLWKSGQKYFRPGRLWVCMSLLFSCLLMFLHVMQGFPKVFVNQTIKIKYLLEIWGS